MMLRRSGLLKTFSFNCRSEGVLNVVVGRSVGRSVVRSVGNSVGRAVGSMGRESVSVKCGESISSFHSMQSTRYTVTRFESVLDCFTPSLTNNVLSLQYLRRYR